MTVSEYSYEPDELPDRLPPQDVPAEQSVLGAMMMSKDAIAVVSSTLHGPDFYRPAHEMIFDTILELFSRGEPADAITVAAELTKKGEITRVGGHVYLHDLLSTVSIAANAGYYADIVREKAILRRLVDASMRIAQLGYAGAGDIEDIVDQAEQAIFKVTDGASGEDYHIIGELLQGTWDEMGMLAAQGGGIAGISTGFTGLDELTNGLHPGQMIIVGARPGAGKSTLGLDFARSAAIHQKMTTAIFSLEMSASEIMMRLLSAEASVPLHAIRTGRLEPYWQN
ncbi:MAG: replicative DNA helicase, partial [Propionibacteriaceae bacterium]|nr:replicative DNA helicase [Propionibacteriaceae bacterium]